MLLGTHQQGAVLEPPAAAQQAVMGLAAAQVCLAVCVCVPGAARGHIGGSMRSHCRQLGQGRVDAAIWGAERQLGTVNRCACMQAQCGLA